LIFGEVEIHAAIAPPSLSQFVRTKRGSGTSPSTLLGAQWRDCKIAVTNSTDKLKNKLTGKMIWIRFAGVLDESRTLTYLSLPSAHAPSVPRSRAPQGA
jgi:hypothetical protein